MLNLFLSLAGIFALIVIVGRLLHRYFIYIPDRARVDPKGAGLLGVEEVVFKAADGRCNRREIHGNNDSSAPALILAPKPPPTSGAITCTSAGSMP